MNVEHTLLVTGLVMAFGCSQRADDVAPVANDAAAGGAIEAGTNGSEERWACFTGPNGELDLEFPKQNPLNECMWNSYSAGGDCYACALERCCTLLQCCGSAAGTNFQWEYISQGVVRQQLIHGCGRNPMTCIQECFAREDALRGESSKPASRGIVESCTTACIEETIATPPEPGTAGRPYDTFPRYAREWVECLLSDTPNEVDATFRSHSMNEPRPDADPPRFTDTSCAAACFPGYQ